MSSLFFILGQLYGYLRLILKSKYKWALLFYAYWIYRVSLMTGAGGGAYAIATQLIPLVGLLYIATKYKRNLFGYSLWETNAAVRTCIILYLFGILSALWAFMPAFAGFMALQNVIMIIVLVSYFSHFKSFKGLEKAFLLFILFTSLMEAIGARIENPGIFTHKLGAGSTAAMCLTYCIVEYVSMDRKDANRGKWLKGSAFLSLILVVISTSAGANAAAVVGIAVGLFFSKKKIFGFLLIILGIGLFLNQDKIDDIILALMPGKTMEDIESSHGRDVVWEAMLNTMPGREWIGWGFACGERRASGQVYEGFTITDSHNSYIGMYCSLGIVGCVLMGIQLIVSLFTFIRKNHKVGYLGLFGAFACACTNAYSYGFLSGKGYTITVVFFALIVLSYFYSTVPYGKRN